MAMNVGIIKEGWVMREEIVEGSMATWKKRYFVLSLQKLSCYKHDKVCLPGARCNVPVETWLIDRIATTVDVVVARVGH
jgi:hypothetical protein